MRFGREVRLDGQVHTPPALKIARTAAIQSRLRSVTTAHDALAAKTPGQQGPGQPGFARALSSA